MDKMKKMASLMLVLVMVLAMAVPAMAEDVASSGTKITMTGGAMDSTYVAYKLLNATHAEVTDKEDEQNPEANDYFAYTLNNKYTGILKIVTEKTTQEEIIQYIGGLNAEKVRTFADSVYAKIKEEKIEPDYTAENGVFMAVGQGYYLIAESATSTSDKADTFSLVMLDTAGNNNIIITTKENKPTIAKKVEEKNDTTGETSWDDHADHDIGDKINYQITGTVSSLYANYKSYDYVISDTMDAGLMYNKDAKVYVVNGDDKVDVTNQFEKVEETHSFTLTANLKKLESVTITKDTKIVVEYTATLNGTAVSGSIGNKNEVILKYENDPYYDGTGEESSQDKPHTPGETPKDVNIVFTYETIVNKVDKDNKTLAGAGFTLYKWVADASKDTNGSWVVVGTEIKVDELIEEKATFNWKGLDAGKYKLVETTVPAGYNKAADVEFEIVPTYDSAKDPAELTKLEVKDANGNVISGSEEGKSFSIGSITVKKDNSDVTSSNATVNTNIVNVPGAELPSTGGMGTTLFYVVGSALVAGAVIVMLLKKRNAA